MGQTSDNNEEAEDGQVEPKIALNNEMVRAPLAAIKGVAVSIVGGGSARTPTEGARNNDATVCKKMV